MNNACLPTERVTVDRRLKTAVSRRYAIGAFGTLTPGAMLSDDTNDIIEGSGSMSRENRRQFVIKNS